MVGCFPELLDCVAEGQYDNYAHEIMGLRTLKAQETKNKVSIL